MGIDQEEEHAQRAAFRAVVKDSVPELEQALGDIPFERWRLWENKASRDLETLALERGSQHCHVFLAKASGELATPKREHIGEGEAVWVFLPDNVQPRQATVQVLCSDEEDSVEVRFWDVEGPNLCVPHCTLRRMQQ